MRGWEEKKLKDVTFLITDGKHGDCKNDPNSGYYFISAKDVRDWEISYKNVRQITKADFLDTNRRTRFEIDDVVIVSTGANIGDIAIAKNKEKTPMTTFQKSVAILKADKSKADPFYIAYFLSNSRTKLHNISSGSAQKNLLLKDLRDFKILLPPLPTQHRIASILSVYDDLIENNLKRIKILEELAQRTYEEWFVKFRVSGEQLEVNEETGLPEGWERLPMTKIAEFLNGFAFKPSDWLQEGIPIIKIKELKNGVGNDTPRNDGCRVSQKFLIESGDIIFSWSGSLEVVIWQGENGWLNQHLFKVVPRKNMPREFVHQGLLFALKEFNNLTTGATMKHIKRKELDFVKIATPKEKILLDFKKKIFPVQEQILKLATENRLLKESRDILLPRLMNRTIDVEKTEEELYSMAAEDGEEYKTNKL